MDEYPDNDPKRLRTMVYAVTRFACDALSMCVARVEPILERYYENCHLGNCFWPYERASRNHWAIGVAVACLSYSAGRVGGSLVYKGSFCSRGGRVVGSGAWLRSCQGWHFPVVNQ